MAKEKMFQYKKLAVKEGEKAPLLVCYANNEMHAMQLFAARLGEKVDKSLIVEYVPKVKDKKKGTKSGKDKK
jgi:hypothetical protein